MKYIWKEKCDLFISNVYKIISNNDENKYRYRYIRSYTLYHTFGKDLKYIRNSNV